MVYRVRRVLSEALHRGRADRNSARVGRSEEGIELVQFTSPGTGGIDESRRDEDMTDGGHFEGAEEERRGGEEGDAEIR
jgi:hypothetical protein